MSKYTTIQQHEPLRVPSGWTADEKRLISQLEELFDDIYRRFNRIRLEDLNKNLRKSIVEASDGVRDLSTRIEQNESSIILTAQVVNNILGGDVPVSSFESSTVAISAAGVHIKTGGVFTVDSGNFDLDEEGNVAIKNANIAGTLSGSFDGRVSGSLTGNMAVSGESVLTGRDVIFSTAEPLTARPGMVWVKPAANVTVPYKLTNAVARSFEPFKDGVALPCQSAPAEATEGGSYRLTLPYRYLGTEETPACTAAISLSNGVSSISLVETLGQAAVTLDKAFTDAAWLGAADSISISITLSGVENAYELYCVDPGAIQLICSAATEDGVLGWNDAEVKVFQ